METQILPQDLLVLEIKTESNLPFWIQRLVNKYQLENTAFSKYCNCIEKYQQDQEGYSWV